MIDSIYIDKLEKQVRDIYSKNPTLADTAIETFINELTVNLQENDRRSLIAALEKRFHDLQTETISGNETEQSVFSGIFALLLGRKVSIENLSANELMERLSEALNTLFVTLNKLIQNINSTLLGGGETSDQTIRQLIGHRLEGQQAPVSLEEYLGRIDKAFFISHQAFRQASHTLVLKLLREIDPEKIASESGQGLKFGPLKKAEHFDIFVNKFLIIKKWFESGRFMEDLLREFENNCHLQQ